MASNNRLFNYLIIQLNYLDGINWLKGYDYSAVYRAIRISCLIK